MSLAVFATGPKPRLADAVPAIRGAGALVDADRAAARHDQQLRHVHGAVAGASRCTSCGGASRGPTEAGSCWRPTASGLVLATKPTAWFAVPGLGLLWLATAARAQLARPAAPRDPDAGGLRRDLRAGGDAVLAAQRDLPRVSRRAAGVAGLPAWRAVTRPGHHAAAARIQHAGARAAVADAAVPAAGACRGRPGPLVRGAGPGARLSPARSVDHGPRRSGRADPPRLAPLRQQPCAFGAAFVLVTVPSLLALPFARRRLGPRWWYALGLAVVGVQLLPGAQHGEHLLVQQHSLPDRDGVDAGGARPDCCSCCCRGASAGRWRWRSRWCCCWRCTTSS